MNPLDVTPITDIMLRYHIMLIHSGIGIGIPVNCACSLKHDPMRHEPELGVACQI
jgi:hypothetical protein